MPTDAELRAKGRSDVAIQISRAGLSYWEIAERLGLEYSRQKFGYWSEERVVSEIEEFVVTHGTPGVMPTQKELDEHGRSDLANAIYDHFDSFYVLAQRVGLLSNELPKKYWQDFSNVEPRILKFIADNDLAGEMPTGDDLRRAGEFSLAHAIEKYSPRCRHQPSSHRSNRYEPRKKKRRPNKFFIMMKPRWQLKREMTNRLTNN